MPRRSASKKVISRNVVGPGANQWYGTLINDQIRYDDGSAVTVRNFLGVKFKSPNVSSTINVNALLNPWQQTSPEITTEDNGDNTLTVTAKVIVTQSHTFQSMDQLTWEINGDLTSNPDGFANSFEFFVDELPSGTVEIECAQAPDPALSGEKQLVYLEKGGVRTPLTASPGNVTPFTVPSGRYTVIASELTNPGETIVATAQSSVRDITVDTGETVKIKISYSGTSKYCTLDVNIGKISSPIDQELLYVQVIKRGTGEKLAEFSSPSNHTTTLRRLPSSGDADVIAETILNNVKYSAAKDAQLSNDVIEVAIGQSDVETSDIHTAGFVDLPIDMATDIDKPSATIFVRLSPTTQPGLIYTQKVPVTSNETTFDVKVSPGQYAVQAKGFLDSSTVYGVQAPPTLSVARDGSTKLELMTRRGANLEVHGFPNFLSFGALSDLVDLEGLAFQAASATSVFKYAGNDGAGDPGLYLSDDPATTKTIALASNVESALGSGHTVLPVMISYTVNLSLGDTHSQLQNKQGLAHSFGNLILSLNLAKTQNKRPVPAGYVINPDFLGECQKGPDGNGLSPEYEMPVIEPLQEALDYRNIDVSIPSSINNTLKGYVLAVNWLIRTVAPEVTFGWQVNIWGVGNSTWMYSRDPQADGPVEMAKKTADYIKRLDAYSGDYVPDFLAIDRYEADDFTQRAYVNSYCYGPYEWGRFYDFCGALSLEMQVPVMPWQIPASRIPNRNETVTNLEVEHWGTGGTYIFGDPNINTDFNNINPKVLAIKPSSLVPYKNVQELFAAAEPFDLSYPAYVDFPMRGIFTVLLGGGATTGIVETIGTTGVWTQEKMNAYMLNPSPFT